MACIALLTLCLLCSPVSESRIETRVPAEEREPRSVVCAQPKSGIIYEDTQTSEANRDANTNTADEQSPEQK